MGQSLSPSINVEWETGDAVGLRADIYYVSTAGVSDSSNTFNVTGSFENYSGAVNVSIPSGGGNQLLYRRQVTVSKVYGSTQALSLAGSISGINYWGGTASASTNYTVAARSPAPPSAPTVAIADITATTARVYTAVAGSENGASADYCNYRLYRTDVYGGTPVAYIGDIGGPTIGYNPGATFTGLTRATSYVAYGQTHNAAGYGDFSGPVHFVTLPVPPTIASTYSITSITRNSAVVTNLSVTDNGGAAPSDVQVQYSGVNGDTGGPIITRGAWANVTIPGLAASTTYYYRVRAANSAGWSSTWGPWKSFTTLADAPNDMAAPTFSSVTDTSFRINWLAPSMNGATFTAYKYDVSTSNTFGTIIATGTTSALFVDITGLTPGTTYHVRVRANATPNNGGYGSASQLTTGIAPNSGMRTYACIDGVIKAGTLYTFIGGVRYQVKPMWQHSGVMETE